MTEYAKDVNGVLVWAQDSDFRGVPNWRTHEDAVRNKKFLPVSGEPEQREGYTAEPATWHVVEVPDTFRTEPRQVEIDDYTENPETHEMEKTGSHMEMRDKEIAVHHNYIQIDTWSYVPVPEPEPEPAPVVRYSKYKIQLACQALGLWAAVKDAIAAANLQDSWSNIVDIASDNEELKKALPDIRKAFGSDTVDAVLAESIAD